MKTRICIWPDDTWCDFDEVEEYGWKSDDYLDCWVDADKAVNGELSYDELVREHNENPPRTTVVSSELYKFMTKTSGNGADMSKETIEKYVQRLKDIEGEQKDHQDHLRQLEKRFNEAKLELHLAELGHSKLPRGFYFGYNDRRGDPQFTPFWYLSLSGAFGYLAKWGEDTHEERTAETQARALAWKMVKEAEIIMYHQEEAKSMEGKS